MTSRRTSGTDIFRGISSHHLLEHFRELELGSGCIRLGRRVHQGAGECSRLGFSGSGDVERVKLWVVRASAFLSHSSFSFSPVYILLSFSLPTSQVFARICRSVRHLLFTQYCFFLLSNQHCSALINSHKVSARYNFPSHLERYRSSLLIVPPLFCSTFATPCLAP